MPQLQTLDWTIIGTVLAISLGIGAFMAKRAGRSTTDFFLSGRNMPWWLLGTSMVATTFAADTPNLVSQIVREHGVSGNWTWWAFMLSAMLTTFVFARLWRRSKVLTDNEFYELRYSGKPAAALRAFRSLYLGLVFNTIGMATVNLAAIKFGTVLLGLAPWQTLTLGCGITVIYSTLGGLRGILATDFFQFIIAITGSIAACIYLLNLPEVGGLTAALAHPAVAAKTSLFPDFSNPELVTVVFALPLLVVWWSSYYPGAEPGGGGYIAQRMLAARNERHAMGATLLFNIAHYALRPWPWILIGLTSLLVFPTVQDLAAALPKDQQGLAAHDIAYPLMIARLPTGLLGLVLASLIAAYMSTISTLLNIGSSYLTHDFYRRFLHPEASERRLVWVARGWTVGCMALAAAVSFILESAKSAFDLMVLIGAGSGGIYLLRWLWWRVNASAEIAALTVSFLTAAFFVLGYPKLIPDADAQLANHWQMVITVTITTLAWLLATLFGPPTADETLESFVRTIKPPGPGWNTVRARIGVPAPTEGAALPTTLLAAALGITLVLGLLLGTGYWIYSNYIPALICTTMFIVSSLFLFRLRHKL